MKKVTQSLGLLSRQDTPARPRASSLPLPPPPHFPRPPRPPVRPCTPLPPAPRPPPLRSAAPAAPAHSPVRKVSLRPFQQKKEENTSRLQCSRTTSRRSPSRRGTRPSPLWTSLPRSARWRAGRRRSRRSVGCGSSQRSGRGPCCGCRPRCCCAARSTPRSRGGRGRAPGRRCGSQSLGSAGAVAAARPTAIPGRRSALSACLAEQEEVRVKRARY